GGEKQGLRGGGAADRTARASDHGTPRTAERDGTDPGDRHHQSRARDYYRGDIVFSRFGHARYHAVIGHADPDRQQLPVLGRMVGGRLPWFSAGGIDPVDQSAGLL